MPKPAARRVAGNLPLPGLMMAGAINRRDTMTSTRIMAGEYDIDYLGYTFTLRHGLGICGSDNLWHLYRVWRPGLYREHTDEAYVGAFATKAEAMAHITGWHG